MTHHRKLQWRSAAAKLRREPKNLPGAVFELSGLSGRRLGEYLLRWLPADALRGTAVEIMSRDAVVIDFERDGVRWRVDTGDGIGKQLFATGSYEGEEMAAVLRWLGGRTGTILDIGANVGTTSVPFARAGYRVIAVEPVPDTFEMLSQNVARNGLSGSIACVRQAITAEPGLVDMWTGFGSGQAEIAVENVAPACERFGGRGELVTVPSGPMNTVVEDPTGVVLVWADVQGSETTVIETGRFLWAAGVPIYLEVDPRRLDLFGGTDHFVEVVHSHFRSFITSDDLCRVPVEQPIGQFAPFVASLRQRGWAGSDALLLP